ncbi:MAG: geranylgeranyl reductase family protein [Syntrophaceae bacterium]|nr:geranylgeranyl reductase family protein [Syntrophaceae bacterium]
MENGKLYDVIIAGAGPAGTAAGRMLAESGARVLILDKARFPRQKPCGGGLPPHIVPLVGPLPGHVLESSVGRVRFSYAGGRPFDVVLDPPGIVMVMRDRFDDHLLQCAEEAGCEVREGLEVTGASEGDDSVEVVTEDGGSWRSRWLIGADGPLSRVARTVGLFPRRSLGIGLSAETEVSPADLERWGGTICIDFGVVPEGYGWVFPKRSHLSCGMATMLPRLPDIRRRLQDFLDRTPATKGRIRTRFQGHLIPYCDGTPAITSRRTLLAGDAASLVDPLTGEGIHFAVLSGRMAARVIAEGRPLREYEEQVNDEIRLDLQYAARLAGLFYRFPGVSYRIGVRSRRAVRYFEELLAGKRTYGSVHAELKSLFAARFLRGIGGRRD